MHSLDLEKENGKLGKQFWTEFDKVLANPCIGYADFTRFVFPPADSLQYIRSISAKCVFNWVKFTGIVNFSYVRFEEDAQFFEAAFAGEANFLHASFSGSAFFGGAVFKGKAEFYYAEFAGKANFHKAIFEETVTFQHACFVQAAKFNEAKFHKLAMLSSMSFDAAVDYSDCGFFGSAFLDEVTFKDNACFDRTWFTKDISFTSTVFTGDVRFLATIFEKLVNFREAKFLAGTTFRRIKFGIKDREPAASFAFARFEKPGAVIFDDVNLGNVLFHDSDLSALTFTPSAVWRTRDRGTSVMVFEEIAPLTEPWSASLKLENGQRNYGLIAQMYQQLKRNYDSRLDYWTANKFHYAEMEMQRVAVPISGWFLGIRQWWQPRFSLVAWYKYASNYGNSYARPAVCLLVSVVLFAVLFPLAGMEQAHPSGNISRVYTYGSIFSRKASFRETAGAELKLLLDGFLVAIDTAAFQKQSEYVPAYPAGHSLVVVETIVTSALLALFLLAIRRQFRR